MQVTESGQAVLRLARQVDLLAADVARELGEGGSADRPTLPIAVNADSMATWVIPALAPLAGGIYLRPAPGGPGAHERPAAGGHRHGGGHRGGRPGCRLHVDPAGRDALPPDGHGAVRRRWFPDGPTPASLTHAPVVVFDRQDDPSTATCAARGAGEARPPVHYVPASADYVDAVALGLGWGMVPDLQAHVGTGDLLELDPAGLIDVVCTGSGGACARRRWTGSARPCWWPPDASWTSRTGRARLAGPYPSQRGGSSCPADVAQLVAHPTCNRAVAGSSPAVGSSPESGGGVAPSRGDLELCPPRHAP